jgi:DNA repair protein RecO (recombination protein O)
MPLSVSALEAARYILSCDLKKLFSFQLPEDDLRRLGAVCEAYLLACMERGFRTLDFYKSVGETL